LEEERTLDVVGAVEPAGEPEVSFEESPSRAESVEPGLLIGGVVRGPGPHAAISA
jgi:hypothetical protein